MNIIKNTAKQVAGAITGAWDWAKDKIRESTPLRWTFAGVIGFLIGVVFNYAIPAVFGIPLIVSAPLGLLASVIAGIWIGLI